MRLLAFELSTEACSVAVSVDGEIHARHEIAPRRHAELALPWAEALLADAGVAKSQLDAIAVGRGPGAFTGVRLGISIAQGIALALDRPVVPVSTLAVLAMRAVPLGAGVPDGNARIAAAIDARMREVYVAAFRLEHDAAGSPVMSALDTERVRPPERLEWSALADGDSADDGAWFGVGTGFAAEGGVLAARFGARLRAIDAEALPQAADVARLAHGLFRRGAAVAPEQLEPAYLRDNVALTIAEQEALRASRR